MNATEEFPIQMITPAVGVIYDSQLCTVRSHWFMMLDNGQMANVATAKFVINPFPQKGSAHYSLGSESVEFHRPGIRTIYEERAFADAIFQAGRWLESEISKASVNRQ